MGCRGRRRHSEESLTRCSEARISRAKAVSLPDDLRLKISTFKFTKDQHAWVSHLQSQNPENLGIRSDLSQNGFLLTGTRRLIKLKYLDFKIFTIKNPEIRINLDAVTPINM